MDQLGSATISASCFDEQPAARGRSTYLFYLVKIERPDGALKVVTRDLPRGVHGQLDSTGRYYSYVDWTTSSVTPAVVFSSLRVFNLETEEATVLVQNNGREVIWPHAFYRNSLLFAHSNVLWRFDLDTHQSKPLNAQDRTPPPNALVADQLMGFLN